MGLAMQPVIRRSEWVKGHNEERGEAGWREGLSSDSEVPTFPAALLSLSLSKTACVPSHLEAH